MEDPIAKLEDSLAIYLLQGTPDFSWYMRSVILWSIKLALNHYQLYFQSFAIANLYLSDFKAIQWLHLIVFDYF